jgi:hypothetical protein
MDEPQAPEVLDYEPPYPERATREVGRWVSAFSFSYVGTCASSFALMALCDLIKGALGGKYFPDWPEAAVFWGIAFPIMSFWCPALLYLATEHRRAWLVAMLAMGAVSALLFPGFAHAIASAG